MALNLFYRQPPDRLGTSYFPVNWLIGRVGRTIVGNLGSKPLLVLEVCFVLMFAGWLPLRADEMDRYKWYVPGVVDEPVKVYGSINHSRVNLHSISLIQYSFIRRLNTILPKYDYRHN